METDSEDEDQESKTAFDELLATTKTFKRKASEVEEEDEDGPHDTGGEYYGVAYLRTLRRPIDPEDPLIGNTYVGQTVRPIGKQYPTALAAATARWKSEDGDAARGKGSDVCFLELLRMHGPEAFENTVVSERRGPKSKLKEWADQYEKDEIASRGGPMRDIAPNVHIHQTFNRTSGGAGVFTINWAAVSAKAWAKFKAELEIYVAATKTTLIPTLYVAPSGYKLGQGVSGTRSGYLVDGHPERCKWLESLPGWSWNTRDDLWPKFKTEIETYVDATGNSLVPRIYVAPSGYKLGMAINGVRNGQLVDGHPERHEWLDSLKGWSWNTRDDLWPKFQEALESYVATSGDAVVPHSYVAPSGYKLGQCVSNTRQGVMVNGHPERRVWLESLPGWSWNLRPNMRISVTPWDDFVLELESYVSEHGTALVRWGFIPQSGYRLGQTVSDVRKGSMLKDKPERREWLNSLPGWAWNGREANRAARLALARSSALPYERVRSKRVALAFYLGKPGSEDTIFQANIDLLYKKVCPRVPPS